MLYKKTIHKETGDGYSRILCEFDKDGFSELVRLGYVQIKSIKGNLPLHVHENCIELTYHIKGAQVYSVHSGNGKITDYQISGGDIFISYPGEVHGSGKYLEDISKFFYFIINMSYENEEFLNLKRDEREYFINTFMGKKPRNKKAPLNLLHDLNSIILIYEKEEISPIDKVVIQNTVFKILCEILESDDVNYSRTYDDIKLVKTYIDNNISEKFCVINIARMCHLSESRFKQKFKEFLGTSPMDYIIKQKIEKSKILISNSNESITQIAMSLNFCSCSYFSKIFKRYVNCTPNEYRKIIFSDRKNEFVQLKLNVEASDVG